MSQSPWIWCTIYQMTLMMHPGRNVFWQRMESNIKGRPKERSEQIAEALKGQTFGQLSSRWTFMVLMGMVHRIVAGHQVGGKPSFSKAGDQ